ncbi:hypothetical protein QJV45_02680 [Listeria booriae]|uniref:hypothetical protein n=1 Tax=Listeria booriae TaxID=1552123 RepID=UPI00288049E2|nr:hypothetical protein [Listeria booriae]MDT0109348.1 hypothetical protein [Listeria booriae]
MESVLQESFVEEQVSDLVSYIKEHYPSMGTDEMKRYANLLRLRMQSCFEEFGTNVTISHINHVHDEVVASIEGHVFTMTFDNFYENTYMGILQDDLGLKSDFLILVHHKEAVPVLNAFDNKLFYQSRYTSKGDYNELALMIAHECRSKRLDAYEEEFNKRKK